MYEWFLICATKPGVCQSPNRCSMRPLLTSRLGRRTHPLPVKDLYYPAVCSNKQVTPTELQRVLIAGLLLRKLGPRLNI